MASTYSTNLKIELMATGENSGTWGTTTNTNLGTALEQAIVGYGNPSFSSDANLTISLTDSNAAQAARALVLNVTSSVSLSATRELVVPTIQKQYIVQNNTTGSQSITVKTSGGTGITVPNGRKAHLYADGTNVIQMFDFVDINGGTIDGTAISPRVSVIADATSVTIDADTTDVATQANTQAVGTLTINAPTGTPVNGQKLIFRLRSTNVQTFSWNAAFAGSTDLGLPTASSGSTLYDYMGFIYNSTASKWQMTAKVFGF